MPASVPVGRFAPSPTGRMHLGNVYAALKSWLSVKSRGGQWILRIEDLDPERSRREYALQLEDDLRWLGLDWDEGGTEGRGSHGPYCQSERSAIYESALRRLRATGLTYGCTCTRAEILSTQAPHLSDGRVIYGGHCRPTSLPCFASEPAEAHSVRIAVPDRDICFIDRNFGPQRFNLAHECGDFILRRKDGAWAYQLAVVTDDAMMGVTEVVRGEDLLPSTAQQLYLYELLGFRPPEFAHIPLKVNARGERLAKRDHAQSMENLREHLSAPEVVRLALGDGEEFAAWQKLRSKA